MPVAAPTGRRATRPNCSKLGWMISKEPPRPTITAAMRRQPTCSFKSHGASNVRIRGSTKKIAMVSASGISLMAMKKHTVAVAIRQPRPACFQTLRPMRKPSPSATKPNRKIV